MYFALPAEAAVLGLVMGFLRKRPA